MIWRHCLRWQHQHQRLFHTIYHPSLSFRIGRVVDKQRSCWLFSQDLQMNMGGLKMIHCMTGRCPEIIAAHQGWSCCAMPAILSSFLQRHGREILGLGLRDFLVSHLVRFKKVLLSLGVLVSEISVSLKTLKIYYNLVTWRSVLNLGAKTPRYSCWVCHPIPDDVWMEWFLGWVETFSNLSLLIAYDDFNWSGHNFRCSPENGDLGRGILSAGDVVVAGFRSLWIFL